MSDQFILAMLIVVGVSITTHLSLRVGLCEGCVKKVKNENDGNVIVGFPKAAILSSLHHVVIRDSVSPLLTR